MRFGLERQRERVSFADGAMVELGPGRLILLTGPSGAGKTMALEQIERAARGCVVAGRQRFPSERAVVDCVCPWGTVADAVSFLTVCGLGEPRLWLRPYAALSTGQQFRVRLAKALAEHARTGSMGPLLCDEFCTGLHPRLARSVAWNLRKTVTRSALCAVVASSDDRLAVDLQPDAIVRFCGRGGCRIEHGRGGRKRVPSLRRGLRIEPGCKRDYEAFAEMHYRSGDEPGFVDKVFVLREGRGRRSPAAGGERLGVVVYAYAPLSLALRNRATSGEFLGNPGRLNESLRTIRRLVVHPDVRGCGLGHYLVRRTLPMVGTEYVECLAEMGEFNPVFEKAGMKRIGQYDGSPGRTAALTALRRMGIDLFAREFVMHVCRNRRVREIVSRVVYRWYAGTTGGGERRVARQSPEFLARTFRGLVGARPVYYLWRRRRRKAA